MISDAVTVGILSGSFSGITVLGSAWLAYRLKKRENGALAAHNANAQQLGIEAAARRDLWENLRERSDKQDVRIAELEAHVRDLDQRGILSLAAFVAIQDYLMTMWDASNREDGGEMFNAARTQALERAQRGRDLWETGAA